MDEPTTLELGHCPSCGNVQDARDQMCEVCGVDTVRVEGWSIPLTDDDTTDATDQGTGQPFLGELVASQTLQPVKGGG